MDFSGRIKLVCGLIVMVLLVAVTAASAAARFKKMDAQGNELADDAQEWAIVYDTSEELYWEVKSSDDSIHSKENTYTYTDVKENFVDKINAENFGGHSDWRLPATNELGVLKVRKKNSPAALIDLQYFPETLPSRYMSHGWCGSKSEYQEESVKFGKQKSKNGKYVRAVRGKPLS